MTLEIVVNYYIFSFLRNHSKYLGIHKSTIPSRHSPFNLLYVRERSPKVPDSWFRSPVVRVFIVWLTEGVAGVFSYQYIANWCDCHRWLLRLLLLLLRALSDAYIVCHAPQHADSHHSAHVTSYEFIMQRPLTAAHRCMQCDDYSSDAAGCPQGHPMHSS